MDLQSVKVIPSRLIPDECWYMGEGGQVIFASPVMYAKLSHPDNPHDQLDALNRFQRLQIDRRFKQLKRQRNKRLNY